MTIEQYISLASNLDSRLERIESLLEQHISKEDPDDDLMTLQEISEYLDVSKQSIKLYCKKRILPFYKVGSKFYFKKTEIENALKTRR